MFPDRGPVDADHRRNAREMQHHDAELVLVCRKLYWQDMDPTHFLDPGIDGKWYPDQDYHRIYIGEIVECLKKV